MAETEKAITPARRSPWPTVWVPLPLAESERALEFAGTNGLAIYAALHFLRFRAPKEVKKAFHASGAQISRLSGLSERSIRRPLRALEQAELIVIARPRGAARLAHEACKYSLRPYFVTPNKVRFGAAKSTGPDAAEIPVGGGNEVGTQIAVSSIAPPTGGVIEPPAAVDGVTTPSSRGGESSIPSDNEW